MPTQTPRWYVYASHAIDAGLVACGLGAAAVIAVAICGILGIQ